MSVVLLPADGSEPDTMCCDVCGRKRMFDAGLPFVNQTASFETDHQCGERPNDAPGEC
jgi:hypothetical protein